MDPTLLIAEVSYDIIKVAEKKGLLNKLKNALRKKHRVLVLGSTGTGKTQFLNSCGNLFADALDQVARTHFPHKRQIEVEGRLFEFTDTPGQKLHVTRRLAALRDALKTGVTGIVNCVCFGYHEYDAPISDAITNGKVRTDYLKAHQDIEIDLLNEWAPLLQHEWIVTLVTKPDIWWDQRDTVMKHYRHGAYANALLAANSQTDRSVCAYSSVMAKFYNTVPCCGEFDDANRKRHRTALFGTLLEAISRVGFK